MNTKHGIFVSITAGVEMKNPGEVQGLVQLLLIFGHHPT